MNITLTPRQLEGLAYGTASRNAANPGSTPMTEDEFAADLLGVGLDAYADEREATTRAALASNERLVALGAAVSAHPDKLDAVEAAVTAILNQ